MFFYCPHNWNGNCALRLGDCGNGKGIRMRRLRGRNVFESVSQMFRRGNNGKFIFKIQENFRHFIREKFLIFAYIPVFK